MLTKVYYAHQGCIYLLKKKKKTVILGNILLQLKMTVL